LYAQCQAQLAKRFPTAYSSGIAFVRRAMCEAGTDSRQKCVTDQSPAYTIGKTKLAGVVLLWRVQLARGNPIDLDGVGLSRGQAHCLRHYSSTHRRLIVFSPISTSRRTASGREGRILLSDPAIEF